MTTGRSVETQEFLTKEPMSSYALTHVARVPDARVPDSGVIQVTCMPLVLRSSPLLC